MNNGEIAEIFLRIADMLEINGENVFRVRAYRTAAQNIKALSCQLADIYREDPAELESIPGIGKDLKGKIIEMIETGVLGYYTELEGEFPPGFLELFDLAGLGPKKLKKMKDELGIGNMNDLEAACRKGVIAEVEGMGARTQGKILDAIAHYRQREGRMLLPLADLFAAEIISYLKGSGKFKKIEAMGSLRRGRETVGDIDILAAASDSAKAMDVFTAYPETGSVTAKGTTKSSVSLKNGPQVDLRIVDDTCFGAASLYFTGSKQHNIKIRKIAKGRGYKISEYGMFKTGASGGERMVAGATEEDMYRALGMEFIEAELREDRGEVEAAMTGGLPRALVRNKDIKGDLHLHTTATDGRDTVEAMISAALSKGYKYIAITEHSKNVKVAGGLDDKQLLSHVDKVRKTARRFKGIEVLAGVEVDILAGGELDFEDSVLKEMDIVVAAIHSRFTLDRQTQTERMLRAMDNRYVNILAHPSGRLITTRRGMEFDVDKVFRKAAENDIFLEINTHGERIDLNAEHCRRAKEMGARFAINTDAHSAEQMDLLKYGVITARRGWLEKDDILNTYTFSKMRKALKK